VVSGVDREIEFQSLVDQILERRWRDSPATATWDGFHTYDHDLDDLSQDKIREGSAIRRDFVRRLEEFDRKALSLEARLDHKVLVQALRSEIIDLDEIRSWEKNPGTYPFLAINSVYLLTAREFAPLSERVQAIAARLKKIPRLLSQGKENVKTPPRVFTEVALHVTEGGMEFLSSVVSPMAPSLREPAEEACRAFQTYHEHLQQTLLPRSSEHFAIGRDLFETKLKLDHALSLNAEDLAEIGQEEAQRIEEELRKQAAGIDEQKSWKEIVSGLKRSHPQPAELLDTYRREMERARDFVQEKELVDFPAGERIEIVPTPLFERATTPYAALMSPAPFEKDQKSFFYVTPAEAPMTEEEQEERLRGHSFASLPVTALHEAYPGHHLQLTIANRISSKVRRVIGTPLFWEGWALYCEEMMYEEGFYTDPRVRLFQLKDALWRACRVIVDSGLHARGMGFEEAVELLVGRAELERPNAIGEVRRYCQTPTYPMSYMMGKREILALRRAVRERKGAGFRLREFHNELLSFGSIPIPYIRKAMLDGTIG
jgi:uncharacterized protein (DUF885 family)